MKYFRVECVCHVFLLFPRVFPWEHSHHFVLSLSRDFFFLPPPLLSNNDSLICQPITPERYLNEPIRTADRMTGHLSASTPRSINSQSLRKVSDCRKVLGTPFALVHSESRTDAGCVWSLQVLFWQLWIDEVDFCLSKSGTTRIQLVRIQWLLFDPYHPLLLLKKILMPYFQWQMNNNFSLL